MSTGANARMMQGRSGPRDRDGLRARIGLRPISCGVLGLIGLAFVDMPTTAVAQNTPPAQAAPQAAPSSAAALPQNTVPPEFAAWWNRLFTFKDGSLYNGLAISFEVYNLYVPPPQRIEEIRAIVKEKPEHPLRVDLQMYEEEIAKPRSRWWTLTVISRDGEWRANRTGATKGPFYRDYAWSKFDAFELSQDRVLVTKPSPDAPEARRFAQVSSDFRSGLDAMLTMGVGEAGDRMLHFQPVFRGLQWDMSGRLRESAPGATVDMGLSGSWDPATRTGRIEKIRSVIRRGNGEVLNLGSNASEFRYEPLLDLQIPRVVIRYAEDGQPRFEYRFKEARKVSASEMKDLLKVPTPNGTDPVRGNLNITKIEDYRGGAAGASLAAGMPPPPSGSKDAPSLRWLGWAAAGGLVALFIGLKLRKSASL